MGEILLIGFAVLVILLMCLWFTGYDKIRAQRQEANHYDPDPDKVQAITLLAEILDIPFGDARGFMDSDSGDLLHAGQWREWYTELLLTGDAGERFQEWRERTPKMGWQREAIKPVSASPMREAVVKRITEWDREASEAAATYGFASRLQSTAEGWSRMAFLIGDIPSVVTSYKQGDIDRRQARDVLMRKYCLTANEAASMLPRKQQRVERNLMSLMMPFTEPELRREG